VARSTATGIRESGLVHRHGIVRAGVLPPYRLSARSAQFTSFVEATYACEQGIPHGSGE
jgi:hypothetical protein